MLLVALTGASAGAQSPAQTNHSTTTPPPVVDTRSMIVDGKAVTERVPTTVTHEMKSVIKAYKAVIFVTNRADAIYDQKISALEDYLSSQITDLGFNVLSREVVVDSLRKFDPVTASEPRPAESLDSQLTEQSSALRLAQNMGVDYIIQASIAGVTNKDITIDAYGVKATTLERTLRVTYKILEASAGGSLTGDTVRATAKIQQTANASTNDASMINELLDESAKKITDGLKTRVAQNRIALTAAKANFVNVNIQLEAVDMMIPDVRLGAENTVSISESKFKVSPLNATVEVDGVAIGSAPGKVSLRSGFSKLRITREGFKTWERTINAVEGQTLSVALSMSDDGYARWKESTEFIINLKNNSKLTDGQVKVLEGMGKMLSESFSRMDTKENVKLIIPGVR